MDRTHTALKSSHIQYKLCGMPKIDVHVLHIFNLGREEI